jgi:type VI protein secretion system component VasF
MSIHQDILEQMRAGHRAQCEQFEQSLDILKKNVEKEKAGATRYVFWGVGTRM